VYQYVFVMGMSAYWCDKDMFIYRYKSCRYHLFIYTDIAFIGGGYVRLLMCTDICLSINVENMLVGERACASSMLIDAYPLRLEL